MFRVLIAITFWMLAGCTTPQVESAASGEIPDIPVEKKDCQSPLGVIPDGGSMTGYSQPVESGGRTCQSGPLICHDGEWSGVYIHAACTTLPNSP